MHLDFAFYIAMHLEGETWHICQRSPAMQIEITRFSVPPRGLFSSLRAVFLRAATTSRDRRSIARPPSPASRARLDEAAHNGTGDRYCNRYCEWERRTAQLTIGTARLFGAGIGERETTAGCLARDRLAAREGVPRNKIFGKKDDGLSILHNGWRSPDFSLAIFIWGFAICLKYITSNA